MSVTQAARGVLALDIVAERWFNEAHAQRAENARLRAALTAAEARVQEEDARAAEWMNTADERLRRLTAAESRAAEALRLAEEAMRGLAEAWRDGYDTASDPAWCEKQLRRAGMRNVEAHDNVARDHFWHESEFATPPTGEGA